MINIYIRDDLDPDQNKPDNSENTRGTENQAGEPHLSEQARPDTPAHEQPSSTEYIDWHWDSDSFQSEECVQFFDFQHAPSRMEGDKEFLRETVRVFLDEYPKILAKLCASLADQDTTTLEREAPSIKGAVAILGVTSTYETAFQLEL